MCIYSIIISCHITGAHSYNILNKIFSVMATKPTHFEHVRPVYFFPLYFIRSRRTSGIAQIRIAVPEMRSQIVSIILFDYFKKTVHNLFTTNIPGAL